MNHQAEHEHSHCCGHHAVAEDIPAGKYDLVPLGYEGMVYTCPMHPDVRDVRNSGCPICGMALEPEGVIVGEEDTSELDDMRRRFWFSTILTLPLFVYAMGEMIPGNARRAVGTHLELKHVHADRAGRQRGIRLFAGRDARARHFSGRVP
jgi:Cu+-exporting ATPase